MARLFFLLASAAINATTIPAAASECITSKELQVSRARWAIVRTRPEKAADSQANCRAYATSFYESVTLRHTTALCNHEVDQAGQLAALDLEIDAFNSLLATKCGS